MLINRYSKYKALNINMPADKQIQKIIKKCQTGDNKDFVYIYDSYINKIYKFIYYKTNHTETAEDLTSKVFFKALKNISKFDPETNFNSWIYRIARNIVIDYYRLKKEESNIDDFYDLDDGEDIEIDFDNKRKIEEVKKYLSNLKTEQREIIILRVWEGLSYKEIAEITGKSEESLKMMFSRVIKKLRKELPFALIILILNI